MKEIKTFENGDSSKLLIPQEFGIDILTYDESINAYRPSYVSYDDLRSIGVLNRRLSATASVIVRALQDEGYDNAKIRVAMKDKEYLAQENIDDDVAKEILFHIQKK